MIKQTVFPSVPGAFPAASFLGMDDALRYGRLMQDLPGTFGICFCPPASFALHQR